MKKRELFVILIFILIALLVLVYAAPQIQFVEPTPDDGNVTTNSWIYVNVSSNSSGGHYAFVNFNNSLVSWWTFDNASGNSSGARRCDNGEEIQQLFNH